MNMTRKHGGKTWIAPNVLIREDVCSSVMPLLLVDLIPLLESTLLPQYIWEKPGQQYQKGHNTHVFRPHHTPFYARNPNITGDLNEHTVTRER